METKKGSEPITLDEMNRLREVAGLPQQNWMPNSVPEQPADTGSDDEKLLAEYQNLFTATSPAEDPATEAPAATNEQPEAEKPFEWERWQENNL